MFKKLPKEYFKNKLSWYIDDEETIDAKSWYNYKGKGGMGSVLDFKIL